MKASAVRRPKTHSERSSLVLRLIVVLCLPCSAGCFSAMGDIQAGALSSTRFESGRYGGVAQVAGGSRFGNDTDAEHIGPGADARLELTSNVKQFSLGPHLYLLPSSWNTPYARFGATLIELGSVDDDFSFGALGPRAELGMFMGPVVISTFARYDLRWTHQSNEGFVGVMVGVGMAVSTASLHR